MWIDTDAFHDAAVHMFHDLGPVDDLGPELSDTVANIYYRFFLLQRNVDDPTRIFVNQTRGLPPSSDEMMSTIGQALASFEYIGQMVDKVREIKDQDPHIAEYMTALALDIFKYRIPEATKKPVHLRASERTARSVDEITGLSSEMRRYVSAQHA